VHVCFLSSGTADFHDNRVARRPSCLMSYLEFDAQRVQLVALGWWSETAGKVIGKKMNQSRSAEEWK
jgi:hypothetical protein